MGKQSVTPRRLMTASPMHPHIVLLARREVLLCNFASQRVHVPLQHWLVKEPRQA